MAEEKEKEVLLELPEDKEAPPYFVFSSILDSDMVSELSVEDLSSISRVNLINPNPKRKSDSSASREAILLENNFDIPSWGIKDYYNERGAWQKQLVMLGEPTWFYFKIFFKFDTQYGLLGNILFPKQYENVNTAHNYLSNIQLRYAQENPLNRQKALEKFVKTLSFISSKAPWAFHSIKDLDASLKYDLTKNPEQKSITIEFLQEAIDMRLSSLFDLYRYVAFDFTHDKEVLPENLRKFDMDIVLFQIPIKYLQTSMKDMLGRKTKYKNLYNQEDFSNRMSFHLFTLQNCEFDISSFSTLIPNSISNEKPFELKPTVKIFYDKCYHHSLNEWINVLVGDAGMYSYDTETNEDQSTRNLMMKYGHDNANLFNPASENYKAIIDASEDILTNAMRVVSPDHVLGNIFVEADWKDMYMAPWSSITSQYKKTVDGLMNPLESMGIGAKGLSKAHDAMLDIVRNKNDKMNFLVKPKPRINNIYEKEGEDDGSIIYQRDIEGNIISIKDYSKPSVQNIYEKDGENDGSSIYQRDAKGNIISIKEYNKPSTHNIYEKEDDSPKTINVNSMDVAIKRSGELVAQVRNNNPQPKNIYEKDDNSQQKPTSKNITFKKGIQVIKKPSKPLTNNLYDENNNEDNFGQGLTNTDNKFKRASELIEKPSKPGIPNLYGEDNDNNFGQGFTNNNYKKSTEFTEKQSKPGISNLYGEDNDNNNLGQPLKPVNPKDNITPKRKMYMKVNPIPQPRNIYEKDGEEGGETIYQRDSEGNIISIRDYKKPTIKNIYEKE